ncbi:hypothetical protein MPSI1_002568 [Malassezia psittaci]|uniref:Uncharacterized protein n=1 Tax=Malassezia psittaci TaxID=1821823 RepID=A0AAF0JEN5_9BASI|nr:hypothetical protein MPSI1_002568 [Malassezia psittaci]
MVGGVNTSYLRDAWQSQQGYTPQDAKQLYIENVLNVLRRFGDRPQAISLMAELEAYSGDVAEQVMDGTLADTASLHSSSVSPSTHTNAYAASQEDMVSSTADEVLPARRTPRHSARRAVEQDANTGSGSHSHETVTVSDLPQTRSQPHNNRNARSNHLQTTTNTHHMSKSNTAQSWQASKPRSSMQATRTRTQHPAPRSIASAQYSEGASRSFASAQPSMKEQQQPLRHSSQNRSMRSGPLGRYAPSSTEGRSASHAPIVKRSSTSDREGKEALQAIQASLVALTERLERAENHWQKHDTDSAQRSTAAMLKRNATAAVQTLRDIGVLLGLIGTQATPVPSYEAWRNGAAYGKSARPSLLQMLLRAPFNFAAQASGILGRLLLDATSIVLFVSVAMAMLRRISGRGDPWILLRLLSQASTRLRFLEVAANRRAALRGLLASAVVGGIVLESRENLS